MSILSELKKVTGKKNAKVISDVIADSGGNFIISMVEYHDNNDDLIQRLDKTFAEIDAAFATGKQLVLKREGPNCYYNVWSMYTPVYWSERGVWRGAISFLDIGNSIVFSVSEAGPYEDAISAYPSRLLLSAPNEEGSK